MICPDCSRRMSVVKTVTMTKLTQRLEVCECGARFETISRIERRLPVVSNDHRQPANGPPMTTGNPPANSGGVGGALSSDPESGSDPDLLSSLDQETTRSDPAIFSFDIVGNGPRRWGVTRQQHDAFVSAFPGVDVMAQYQKAAVWLTANPTKRKTARGMARFLFGWMERQQNGVTPIRPQTLNGGPPIANGAHPGEKPWIAAERQDRERRARESAEADRRSAAALAAMNGGQR